MTLRVIQWATGTVGRQAVAAVHDHPELALVGAYVYSERKTGRDVGDIAGIGPIGVTATRDIDEILALEADCVLYMPQGEMNPVGAVDDICRLLASGKNVISTAVTGLIYPPSLGSEVVERLETACAAGSASFHATGIEPGWAAEVLPLTISPLLRRTDSVLVQELLDYSTYDSAAMLTDIMGFGKHPGVPVVMADPAAASAVFRAPLMLLAAGLGADIDDFVFSRSVAVAAEPFETVATRIEAGTVSAQRFSYTAIVCGRPALTIEHITRMRHDQAPDWPRGRGWRVTIEGTPSFVVDAVIGAHDENEVEQSCLGTAMHAVHAVVPVCAAEPGIRTFLDLPIITGRHILGLAATPGLAAIVSPREQR
ncbi:NAD(P)H-dependent amine dehydrogenase family protein [Nocardia sp. NPDC055321]